MSVRILIGLILIVAIVGGVAIGIRYIESLDKPAIYGVPLPSNTSCTKASSVCKKSGGHLATENEMNEYVMQGRTSCTKGYGQGCYLYVPSQGEEGCGKSGINKSKTYYGTADHPCSKHWKCPRMVYCGKDTT